MRFGFWPGPTQEFEEVKALALHAEAKGWDGVWFADHFMANADDVSGPWYEAWTTLAALAATVPRVRLGPLVTGNTYRHPAVLAKMAATVDHISGGRLVLGLGAGWQENEHQKYGIPFHTLAERLRRLEEAAELVRALLEQERATTSGKYYALRDAPLEPKPVRGKLPLLIGGGGEKVTMRIAARYADEWNVWGTPERLHEKMAVLDRHCEALGRDPKTIERSACAMLFLSDDPAFVERVRKVPPAAIAGGISALQDTVGAYAEAGVNELIIPDMNLRGSRAQKLDVLDRFIEEIAPAAKAA